MKLLFVNESIDAMNNISNTMVIISIGGGKQSLKDNKYAGYRAKLCVF